MKICPYHKDSLAWDDCSEGFEGCEFKKARKKLTDKERYKELQDLHDDYWDCECSKNYIHAKSKGMYCPVCNCYEIQGMPDSRALEVAEDYDPKKDKAIHKESICPVCKKAREYGWCCDCPDTY